jgi:hypothetical protein
MLVDLRFRIPTCLILAWFSAVPLFASAWSGPFGEEESVRLDAEGASCSTCDFPSNQLFRDTFGSGTTCAWSARIGSSDSCPEGGSCGDCAVDAGEACDEGPDNGATDCPYGTIFCERCNFSCTALVIRLGTWCGDHVTDFELEECDDGNMMSEAECPYGNPGCETCAADCQSSSFPGGPSCGDGNLDSAHETCDDGNQLACGTCSGNCLVSQPAAFATGLVVTVAGNQIADGETLQLSDGVLAMIFEFDHDDTCCTNGIDPIAILVSDTADAVAVKVQNAVDFSGLALDASILGGAVVSVINDSSTSFGNIPISESVADTGFVVMGMAGGAAGDCSAGTGCSVDADCASGSCGNGEPGVCD